MGFHNTLVDIRNHPGRARVPSLPAAAMKRWSACAGFQLTPAQGNWGSGCSMKDSHVGRLWDELLTWGPLRHSPFAPEGQRGAFVPGLLR